MPYWRLLTAALGEGVGHDRLLRLCRFGRPRFRTPPPRRFLNYSSMACSRRTPGIRHRLLTEINVAMRGLTQLQTQLHAKNVGESEDGNVPLHSLFRLRQLLPSGAIYLALAEAAARARSAAAREPRLESQSLRANRSNI